MAYCFLYGETKGHMLQDYSTDKFKLARSELVRRETILYKNFKRCFPLNE